MAPTSPSVLVPVGKDKDLPEPAIMVLRGLWGRLGYQGGAFVDMQLEITKELAHADFARFEREMLCNEIISLRQELDMSRQDRSELIRKAESAQANLSQVIEAEERTFKALLSEREVAKRAIERAEKGVQQVVIAKEKEAVRAEAMSEQLHRLEKERIAAVLYAKTAEEQAAVANMTAKAAAAVAVSAVQTGSSTPRLNGPMTPRITPLVTTPSPKLSSHIMADSNVKNPLTNPKSPRISDLNLNIINKPITPLLDNHKMNNWTKTDEAILKSKIKERELDLEENFLVEKVDKLFQDRIKLKLDREDILSSNSTSNPISSSLNFKDHSNNHHNDMDEETERGRARFKEDDLMDSNLNHIKSRCFSRSRSHSRSLPSSPAFRSRSRSRSRSSPRNHHHKTVVWNDPIEI